MKEQPSWSMPESTAASICFVSKEPSTKTPEVQTQLADSLVLLLLDRVEGISVRTEPYSHIWGPGKRLSESLFNRNFPHCLPTDFCHPGSMTDSPPVAGFPCATMTGWCHSLLINALVTKGCKPKKLQ